MNEVGSGFGSQASMSVLQTFLHRQTLLPV